LGNYREWIVTSSACIIIVERFPEPEPALLGQTRIDINELVQSDIEQPRSMLGAF
jgi:hypothetical protein